MAQVPHVEATDTAADITAGLQPGCYVAQVVASLANLGDQAVLFATAEIAPTDDADWFRAGFRQYFSFAAGSSELPTWVKTTMAGLSVPVALAMVA